MRSLALSICFGLFVTSLSADALTPKEKFFEREVRPLLIEHCHECHSGELQESDLRLDSMDSILQGGISGPAAIAGNLDDSLILNAVMGTGLELMPPDGRLEPEQIVVIRKWIKMGLPWTKMPATDDPHAIALGDQEAIGRASENHWSFQPIADPPVPVIDGTTGESFAAWNDHPIDAFVWNRLRSEGLEPNLPADRRTIARRLYYDLVGLPPTINQVETFENDSRSDTEAARALADELLSSVHHGERWARYWLDVARYADTRDWQAQAELRYPYAYTYRDYVIDSFNRDKPYDQFITEQLAADFLSDDLGTPEMAALGFLSVGPKFRNNTLERVADRIDVVCRGLMGVTVACARCHDHKYDPIPIEDYYSLYGVFSNTEDYDEYPVLNTEIVVDESVRADYEKKVAAAKRKQSKYKEGLRRDAINDMRRSPAKYLDGFYLMSIAKSTEIRGVVSKLKVLACGMTPLSRDLTLQLTKKADPSDPSDPILGPWFEGLDASVPTGKKGAAKFKTLTKKWIADESLHPLVRKQLKTDVPVDKQTLVKSYGTLFENMFQRWRIQNKSTDEPMPLADADWESLRQVWAAPGGWLDLNVEAVSNASRINGKGRKALGDLQKAIVEVGASHPGAPPRAMAVRDAKPIRGQFVMLRGEANRRGDNVPKRFPAFLQTGKPKVFQDGSGRLELAQHIVDPKNPLTARVIVNRVWSKYFGKGLAKSLDDFGLRSDPPSHPDLLDHLATGLIQNGWSLKWLHRTITSSQAYLQSSEIRDAAASVDPENDLMWRQNRRRLDFEAMRDSMLVVADTLDATVGGRSVKLSETPYSNRRSVYAYVDRIEMDPMLRTFDFASPTASAASRAETMIPQQALFKMNHPMVVELSQAIEGEVKRSVGEGTVEAQVTELYRRVFARHPSASELQFASSFLNQSQSASDLPVTLWSYGYGPIDADSRDVQPLAYWTGKSYQVSEAFPDPVKKHLKVTAGGAHPGQSNDESVIRRWTAPVSGTVRITGTAKHDRPTSDGIDIRIRFPGGHRDFKIVDGQATTNTPPIKVQVGDPIDFVVGPRERPTADSHGWSVKVIGIGGQAEGQTWDSIKGFQPPPPPPLEPLAQLAQALLITNEFIFLD